MRNTTRCETQWTEFLEKWIGKGAANGPAERRVAIMEKSCQYKQKRKVKDRWAHFIGNLLAYDVSESKLPRQSDRKPRPSRELLVCSCWSQGLPRYFITQIERGSSLLEDCYPAGT